MAEINNANESNKRAHHIELPKYDVQDHSTIYKLTLSMRRRFSPAQVGGDSASPVEAREVRELLQRLVEIDSESRGILCKLFSLLEKDETLENYVKNRIEDPKVSRMWQLVEQVLACQEGDDTNLDEMIMAEDDPSNYSTYDNKSIKEGNETKDEMRIQRFRVRNIDSGPGIEDRSSSSTSAASSVTTSSTK
ncbi:hypothetical protein BVRB_7g160120 [Beta vulgaris subsp. vulgaris]|nr:hypothetical protein BVRB_7g160120 [Beta vulgaris subsp. vulgaris]